MEDISKRVYLDTNILQKDLRIRIPKQILTNLNATPGETYFDIYLDPQTGAVVLRKAKNDGKNDLLSKDCMLKF